MRRRARHRLIGASVLVLVGVLGFPLLFDTQPRPIPVDIPIEIPAKNTAAAPSRSKPAPAQSPKTGATPVSANESLGEREELLPNEAATPSAPAPSARPTPAKSPAPATASASARPQPAAQAKALQDNKTAAERFVVQVGAFADETRAREVRLRVESAGLKTYTHVAETPEGRRIRVRVGPFTSRAEADKAAERIKAQGLPAGILTL